MKNNIYKKIIPIILGIPILFIVIYFMIPMEYKISQKNQTITIELGEELDTNIHTYIDGQEKAISQANLDIEQVDTFHSGSYNAYVTLGEKTLTYTINVVDTTAPQLVLNNEIKFIGINRDYTPQHFIKEFLDLSNNVETFFFIQEELQPTVCFEKIGEQELTIVAIDDSGNKTTGSIIVTIEQGPILIGVEDVTIPTGTTYDVLSDVIALDEKDGIISNNITTTPNEIDFSTSGEYEITYSILNSNGIETSKTCKLTVSDNAPDDYKHKNDLTIDELQLLCDYGYFKYEPLEEENYDKVLEYIRPTSLYIDKNGYGGSAFIYKITPEYTYIGSVNHVLKLAKNDAILIFHNDTIIPLNYNYVTVSNTNELAMFKIKTNEIPRETLLTLKEAHFDINIYDKLYENQKLVVCCENFKGTQSSKIKTCTLYDALTSYTYFNLIDSCLTTNAVTMSGMSGGPIYDYKGNLVGTVTGHYKGISYHTRIDKLEELRQRLDE